MKKEKRKKRKCLNQENIHPANTWRYASPMNRVDNFRSRNDHEELKEKKRKSRETGKTTGKPPLDGFVFPVKFTTGIAIIHRRIVVRVAAAEYIVVNVAIHPEVFVVELHLLFRGRLVGWHDESLGDICLGGFDVGCSGLFIAFRIGSEHDSRVDIGGGRNFCVVKEGQDGYQDRLNALSGGPTFCRQFSRHLIVAWRVENGDTQFAVLIDVWVEQGPEELEFCVLT